MRTLIFSFALAAVLFDPINALAANLGPVGISSARIRRRIFSDSATVIIRGYVVAAMRAASYSSC